MLFFLSFERYTSFFFFFSFVETQAEMGITLSSEEEEISERELEDPI